MSSSPDINLLALFSNREKYEKYKDLTKTEALLVGETATILGDMQAWYDGNPSATAIDFDSLRTFARVVRHRTWSMDKHEVYDAITTKIEERTKLGCDEDTIKFFVRLDAANKITDICKEVALAKHEDFDRILPIIESVKRTNVVDISSLFGPTDLKSILDKRVRKDGFEWRLDVMNRAVGPLHSGDLVLMAARPEAGKTSWVCSEFTHMVKYLPEDKDAVIFNPEEGGGRLFLRLLTASTGKDLVTIASDESEALRLYESAVGRRDRIQVVEPAGGISTRDVEKVLDTGKFGLVAINVLDKIKLPKVYGKDDGEVSRYRQLAYWMREAANRYQVPILAVAQASDAAEGVRYLSQNMIYQSRTGVQGELDLLIGMGYDVTVEDRRWFSILKNKLPGGAKTLAALKHGRFEVKFDPATGRYTDL